VTLIEVEALEALARNHGIELAPHEQRRNLTTRGVPLNHLVGQYFRIGNCVIYDRRLNVPCLYLEHLVPKRCSSRCSTARVSTAGSLSEESYTSVTALIDATQVRSISQFVWRMKQLSSNIRRRASIRNTRFKFRTKGFIAQKYCPILK
jgi:MOSC domain-containing protein YiiM